MTTTESAAANGQRDVPIRDLIAKVGLDGHSREGGSPCAARCRDRSHLFGASLHSRTDRARRHPRRCRCSDDTLIVVGGLAPTGDILELERPGAARIFPTGSQTHEIVDWIHGALAERDPR